MASADQLRALLQSYIDDDDARFYSVAMQVAAHEAKLGHGKVADDLREVDASQASNDMTRVTTEGCAQVTDEEFRAKLAEAKSIVEGWPEWKKAALENSFKSRNPGPREPLEEDDTKISTNSSAVSSDS